MSKPKFSLGEGNTPLVRSRRIGPDLGLKNLYFKLESLNPTGSYKDRFAAAAVTEMLENGSKRVIATSSGNAGAALAAYCAAAGIECRIALVQDAPEGKLKQMMAYGALLSRVEKFGIDPHLSKQVMDYLAQLGQQEGNQLQISAYCYSPIGMAGVETISHELARQCREQGSPLHHVFVAAGGGGLTLAIARGFQSLAVDACGKMSPQIHCVQPAGNATIAGPLSEGASHAIPCTSSTTKVTGLQVPNVLDGDAVIAACQRSGGTGHLVSDGDTYDMQRRLAREEGIFCEPAAAVALAGAIQALHRKRISSEETIVCVVTGTGFKDPEAVNRILADCSCPSLTFQQFQDSLN